MSDQGKSRTLYIGDGVYASCDGWMIRLCTEAQIPKHEIFLEPQVFESLLRYAGKIWNTEAMINVLKEVQDQKNTHLDDL